MEVEGVPFGQKGFGWEGGKATDDTEYGMRLTVKLDGLGQRVDVHLLRSYGRGLSYRLTFCVYARVRLIFLLLVLVVVLVMAAYLLGAFL